MKRTAQYLSAIPALVAIGILATVIVKGAVTVLELRRFGETTWPLITPLNLVPAAMIAVSLMALARGRNGLAALLGIVALIVASIFFLSQASGAVG